MSGKNSKFSATGILAGGALVMALGLSQPLSAAPVVTLGDQYIGANDHGYGDLIERASTDNFDIFDMQVSRTGNTLSVSVRTEFAGKGDDGLFSGYTGGKGIGYGDLFLARSWTPFGSPDYANDDASNGTIWEYGFALDDRWMSELDSGTGTLYRLNSGNNAADILMSDDFISGATFRNGQEVAVDTAQGNVTAISDGSWSIDAADQRIEFVIDLTGTGLANSGDLALRWQMTCANDVIEASVVPLPAAVWLFGSGLVGLAGIARRKKTA